MLQLSETACCMALIDDSGIVLEQFTIFQMMVVKRRLCKQEMMIIFLPLEAYTVEGHVLTRSGQDLTQAWAGQTHFNIGVSARLGRAHIHVLKCVQSVIKHVGIRNYFYKTSTH